MPEFWERSFRMLQKSQQKCGGLSYNKDKDGEQHAEGSINRLLINYGRRCFVLGQ